MLLYICINLFANLCPMSEIQRNDLAVFDWEETRVGCIMI